MSQTAAIFVDAYRDLNAKKLFWVVLGLSALIVLAFLAVGIDASGLSILGIRAWGVPNTGIVERATFYKGLFVVLGVDVWLTFAATILALVSTAGVFPDLIVGGSIDLYLSKPIGRLRLFLTRYVAALTFVFLQVTVFSAASFLVLGVRGGEWLPGVFMAVPLVLAFYSYLYCVCVLIGLVTRSTIAAMLLTILFWFAVIGLHTVESWSLGNRVMSEVAVERLTQTVADREAKLAKYDAEGGEKTQVALRGPQVATLDQARKNLAAAHDNLASSWHAPLLAAKTVLPKTSETVALLQRSIRLATNARRPGDDAGSAATDAQAAAPVGSLLNPGGPDFHKAQLRTAQIIEGRSVGWVVGTSLAFEAVVLALAAWVFCRRDY